VDHFGAAKVDQSLAATSRFHAAAGLRVFLSRSFALSGEYRRQFAEANMSGDFAGKHLDLTGSMITLGLIYRF